MAVIAIHDWDYFHYQRVIPNLECAKLCTYFQNKKQIAVLSPTIDTQHYTDCYVRKEYDDGNYPTVLQQCIYGGQAFNPQQYIPLEPLIEKTIPNMHLYDQYIDYYGNTQLDKRRIKRLLNCAHIRLSTDEQMPKSLKQLENILSTHNYTGIIFHDYDLGKVKDAYDIIYDISRTRTYKIKGGIHEYPIGNKFPIQVNSMDELLKWFKINVLREYFFIQYNGLLEEDMIHFLCKENKKMTLQLNYNITGTCKNEEQFVQEIAPIIFRHITMFRGNEMKIQIIYDPLIITTKEVQDFIELLNCWANSVFANNTWIPETLFSFCKRYSQMPKLAYWSFAFRRIQVSIDEARQVFGYFKKNNYELFKQFYELDTVDYKLKWRY